MIKLIEMSFFFFFKLIINIENEKEKKMIICGVEVKDNKIRMINNS